MKTYFDWLPIDVLDIIGLYAAWNETEPLRIHNSIYQSVMEELIIVTNPIRVFYSHGVPDEDSVLVHIKGKKVNAWNRYVNRDQDYVIGMDEYLDMLRKKPQLRCHNIHKINGGNSILKKCLRDMGR